MLGPGVLNGTNVDELEFGVEKRYGKYWAGEETVANELVGVEAERDGVVRYANRLGRSAGMVAWVKEEKDVNGSVVVEAEREGVVVLYARGIGASDGRMAWARA